MSKSCGRRNPVKGRPNPKPQGVAHGKRAVQNIDVAHNMSKHVQVIGYNRATNKNTAIIYTGSQQYMIGMGRWDIVKRHGSWIYDQGVYMGGYPKLGRRLWIIGTRGEVKKIWNGSATLL